MNATDDLTTEESSAVTLDHVTRTYKRDEFEVRALRLNWKTDRLADLVEAWFTNREHGSMS